MAVLFSQKKKKQCLIDIECHWTLNMKSIPRIIHQTWKDQDIPAYYQPLIETWKEKHPDWKYIMWTDSMNEDFLKRHHPDFLSIYRSYPHNIQRVDAVRYFILQKYGGVFVDMDFECILNIEPLICNDDCVFGIEPQEHCQRFNKKIIICNAFMASNIGNDFLKDVCSNLKSIRYANNNAPVWKVVLESTGPFKLTEVYDSYKNKDNIKLLPSNVIYPLSLHERDAFLKKEKLSDETLKRVNNAYAIHYFFGSWW